MKQSAAILIRFAIGFFAVAGTCALALEKEAWREQLVILISLAVLAGVACAFWPVCAQAIKKHWTF